MKKNELNELAYEAEDNSVKLYIHEIIKPLSHSNIMELFEKFQSSDDEEQIYIRNKIACNYLRLVASSAFLVIGEYPGLSISDLIQEGNLALLECIESLGKKSLKSYSYIFQSIQYSIFNRLRQIVFAYSNCKIPKNKYNELKRLKREKEKLEKTICCNIPSWFVIDQYIEKNEMNSSEEDIFRSFATLFENPNPVDLADMEGIPDNRSLESFTPYEKQEYNKYLLKHFVYLSERNESILKMYLNDIKLSDIAEHFQLTKQSIMSIIEKSLSRIRWFLLYRFPTGIQDINLMILSPRSERIREELIKHDNFYITKLLRLMDYDSRKVVSYIIELKDERDRKKWG